MTTSVLVVDDQPLFCSGIEMLISAEPDLVFAGACHSGLEAITASSRTRPDVVLMDLRMPDGNGIVATRTITQSSPAPNVLILTTFRDQRSTAMALDAGASGFITKDATPDQLLAAIRDTAAGILVRRSPSSTRMLSDPPPSPSPSPIPDLSAIETLTPRERELFLHAARGLSNPDIAAITHISENTVRTHVSSILSKLELGNRHELIHYAHQHALLPEP